MRVTSCTRNSAGGLRNPSQRGVFTRTRRAPLRSSTSSARMAREFASMNRAGWASGARSAICTALQTLGQLIEHERPIVLTLPGRALIQHGRSLRAGTGLSSGSLQASSGRTEPPLSCERTSPVLPSGSTNRSVVTKRRYTPSRDHRSAEPGAQTRQYRAGRLA